MKKGIKIIVCLAIVAGLAGGGWYLYRQYQQREAERIAREEYLATHVTIDGTDYETSLTELDLSGKTLTQWRGLERIHGLQKLDLRDTGISPAEVQTLREALPKCHIRWSVPFQGSLWDSETRSLRVNALSEEDFETLAFFPKLREVNLGYVREAAAVLRLREQYPELSVSYRIMLGTAAVLPGQETLDANNADLSQLSAILPLMTNLKEI